MKKLLSRNNGTVKRCRRFAAFLLTATVILLTLSLASCGKTEPTAREYFEKAIENTFYADGRPSGEALSSTLTEIVWNSTADTAELGLDSLSIKLYSSAVSGALELDLAMMGSSLNAKGYFDESSFALKSDLWGSTVYGADLTKLEQSYAGSIFADPNSLYYIGSPSEIIPTVVPTVDANALAERYITAMETAAYANSTATLSDRDGGGKSVSFVFNNDGIKGVIRACYDLMKDDAELRELIAMYFASEEEANGFLQEFDALFASEEDLNELLAELDQGSYEMKLTVLTNEDDVIETATLAFHFEDAEATGSVEVALDMSKENAFELSLVIDAVEGAEKTPYYQGFAITVKEKQTADGGKNTVLTLDVVQAGGMKVSLELFNSTYYEESGNFSVMLLRGVPDIDTVKLKGKVTVAEDEVSLSVTELTVGASTMAVDIRLSISAVESVPAVPAYTDVFTLTEAQMEAIGEALVSHPLLALLFSE